MAMAADHEGRARPPVAVIVKAPRDLHALYGCAALTAVRRCACGQLGSIHDLTMSFTTSISVDLFPIVRQMKNCLTNALRQTSGAFVVPKFGLAFLLA